MHDLDIYDKRGNQYFLSPKFTHLLESLIDFFHSHDIQNHVFFFSSGTTSTMLKGYAISRHAMMDNAKAVNDHLNLSTNDRWGLTLPPYHVGGISILFRSLLLKNSPHDLLPWTPQTLAQEIQTQQLTAISLVPSQIYDLVRLQIKAPPELKIALAGGDFLSDALEKEAHRLDWPLYRTFGMSEVGSQLATATEKWSREMKILSLHQVKTDVNQKIWVKSPSLFSFELHFNHVWGLVKASDSFDEDGFYPLPDKGALSGMNLIPMGRDDGHFKMSGRLLDFTHLKNMLDSYMLKTQTWGKMELLLKNDVRKGKILCLVSEKSLSEEVRQQFLVNILPIKIDAFILIDKIERTELGKFKQSSYSLTTKLSTLKDH